MAHVWLTRMATAVAAATTMGYLLATQDDRGPVLTLFEVLVCIGAAVSGWWPIRASVATGFALTVLAAANTEHGLISVFLCLIPLAIVTSRGMWSVSVFLSIWYLVAISLIELGWPVQWDMLGIVVGGWLPLFALILAVGGLVHGLSREFRRASARKAEDLRQQRLALARDLHDGLAREVTLLVLCAEQSLAREKQSEKTADDLRRIVSGGRAALKDLNGLMSALRATNDESSEPVSSSRGRSPEAAVASAQQTLEDDGFEVQVVQEGSLDDLPHQVQKVLSAAVLEATSNVLRHARPRSRCTIMVEVGGHAVTLLVTNVMGGRFEHGNGLGLVGLKERLAGLGGSLTVTHDDERWLLHVDIPLSLENVAG